MSDVQPAADDPMDVDQPQPINDNPDMSITPTDAKDGSAADKSEEAHSISIQKHSVDTSSQSTPPRSVEVPMPDRETVSNGMINRELSNSHADSSARTLEKEDRAGAAPEPHLGEEIQPEASSALQTRPGPEPSSVPPSVQPDEDPVPSAPPIQEDPADPIEPAEDPVPTPPEDPIEEDSAHPQVAQNARESPRVTNAPLSMVQRMKNRRGKLSSKDDAPILASQLGDASQSANAGTPSPEDKADGGVEGTTARKTRSASQKAVAASGTMAPPPETPLTTKRRGRPPVPAEEKARRQAEKDAEKAAKAAVKQAEKEEKARLRAAKAAEKAAQIAAKAAAKAGKKGKNDSSAPSASASSAVAPLSVSDKDAQPNAPRGNREELSTQQSVAKWTTLTQTPSIVDADMTMLDELRSSSPAHSVVPATSGVDELRSESGNLRRRSDAGVDHAHDETDQHASQQASDSSQTPLFLPGTQTQAVSPRRIPRSSPTRSAASSGSESDDFKLPARPRTWGASARFRRLSEIATQELFTPLPLTPPTQRTPALSTNMKDMYGLDDDEDEEEDGEDDDDDSGSDDAANRSHIPQGRRAGAGVPKKRSGLL